MDEICLVTPVLAGRADAARDFLGRLDGDSRADYQRSEQRLGISKEVWFLASGPRDVSLVAYIEAAGFAHSLRAFAASRDGFDVWFKHQLLHVSGVDLNEAGHVGTVLIIVIVIAVIALPLILLARQFRSGEESEAGGSLGDQISHREDDD